MATLYGVNYTDAYVDEPSSKVNVKELSGKVRRLYDSYVLTGELTTSDSIYAGKLPKGAKIIDARFIAPSDGTTGQYNFGILSNGVDAADADFLFAAASLDTGAGAVDAKMLGTVAGWNAELGAETILVIACAENTTASSGDTLEWEVQYVIE